MAKCTRRRFLRGAVAAAAAPYVLTSTALGAAGRAPANDRINVVCIGIRNRGGNHLSALLGDADVQVLGICDVDKAIRDKGLKRVEDAYAARGGYKGAIGWNDFREVTARPDVDAVTIATPDHTHAIISLAALRSGKDVFVEKPMTLTIREGQELVQAVRRYGRVLQVGAQRRSEAGVRHMCELVRNGRIGRLVRVECGIPRRPAAPMDWRPEPVPPGFDYDLWLGPAPWQPYTAGRCHYNFRFIFDYSGGEMTNFGTHYFDVAQWGIGADDSGPVEIEGTGDRWPTGLYDTYYNVRVEYAYAGGVKLLCTTGGGGTRFVGTEGTLPGTKVANDEIGPNDIQLYRTGKGHMGNFIECIRTRRDPSANVESGHRSASVCHLGNIAMLLGRRLRWDPVKEEFPGDDEANRMRDRPYRPPWTL